MSGEDRNHRAQCRHAGGEQDERDVNYTRWLMFSVLVCVFGNSFPYGYNIGVVNSPASTIKLFFAQVDLAKNGIVTRYTNGHLYFVDQKLSKHLPVSNCTVNATGDDVTHVDTKYDQIALPKEELDWWWSVTVASFVLFGMIGAFFSGNIADGFGRKRGMIITSFAMLLAAILGGISSLREIRSPVCLIVSRAIAGLHCGINLSLAALYLAEISPKNIRGAVGTIHQLFITLGLLWSMMMGLPEIAGTWELWPWCFVFNAIPALVCLPLFLFCPESPRFLLIYKKEESKAEEALRKLRGSENIESEIAEMRFEAFKASTVTRCSLRQLLTRPELRKPLAIAIVCPLAQQWSGINALMSYSSFVYRQASVPITYIPYVVVGQGVVNVIATIVAIGINFAISCLFSFEFKQIPLLEKAGRRKLLIYPMIVMALSHMAFTVCLCLLKRGDSEKSNNGLAIACIVLMFTYIVGFAIGLGPVPYVVVPEMFRQESRAAAVGFSAAINWICNLILTLLFISLQKTIEEYMYVIFAIVLFFSAFFFIFFLPETKNRTFDDIADSVARWRAKRVTIAMEETWEEMQPIHLNSISERA